MKQSRAAYLVGIVVVIVVAIGLAACGDVVMTDSGPMAFRTATATLLPGYVQTPQAAQAEAQATLAAGQGQLMELALHATQVNMAMTQAASTEQAFQRQTAEALASTDVQIERERQGTQQAAAATATAASVQATSTQVAWDGERTRTADAMALMNTQAAGTQSAQSTAAQAALYQAQTQTAAPPTQTAAAATQVAIQREIEQADREAFWRQFTTPLTIAAPIVFVVMVGLLLFAVYRRMMPIVEARAATQHTPDGDLTVLVPSRTANGEMQLLVINPKRSFGPVIRVTPTGSVLEGVAADPEHQDRTTGRQQMTDTVGLLANATIRSSWADAFGRLFGRGKDDRRRSDIAQQLLHQHTHQALGTGMPRTLPRGYVILNPGATQDAVKQRIIPPADLEILDAEYREIKA